MNDKPIGILDSGIGGLTIAKEIISLLPEESIIYIGDSKNAPYGPQTSEQIYKHAKKIMKFLVECDAKLIVIACNTITVNCINQLRDDFPLIPIVGTVPVIKTAAEVSRNKRIGILSTSQTAKSEFQKLLIKQHAKDYLVFEHGTDALVPLIEKGIFKGEKIDTVLHKILDTFKKEKIDALALGCTHFPLIRQSIQKQLENVILLDPGAAIARHVDRILKNNAMENKKGDTTYQFYSTGDTRVMQHILQSYPYNTISYITNHLNI